MSERVTLAQGAELVRNGGVIAYATEAVFGLGCDPDNRDAVMRLLAIKQRPVEKGLILLAADFDQLRPYVDESALSAEQLSRMFDSWPGPFTWVVPAKAGVPNWISGKFDSIAVRVTAHPEAAELARLSGKPLISTSANLSGQAPGRSVSEVQSCLTGLLDGVVDSTTGAALSPSTIRDAISGDILRGN
ncbi:MULTISPECIES: L-threonylcarbamoyladenylate synthase [Ferrimonas]|uniref:L-threonylcarbamoyladenylate synthase n=1 Tax=Ferrimonas TaxID=44011 RepID=UPI0003F5329F|nr:MULTISPECIES: L-threonylcarbamoyladenylate synthase [Ferrimonas]USD37587.1 threonylcarbamoyl-AMP synthase [Ferrimonas sp. SCSIO 43195]